MAGRDVSSTSNGGSAGPIRHGELRKKRIRLSEAQARAVLQTAFSSLPALMQRVQARIDWVAPFTLAFTFWRFGSHRRRVLLLAWDTLFPDWGPLPQISQRRAISRSLDFSKARLDTLPGSSPQPLRSDGSSRNRLARTTPWNDGSERGSIPAMGKGSRLVVALVAAACAAGPVRAADIVVVASGPDAPARVARQWVVEGARDGDRTVLSVAEARRRLGRPFPEALAECEDAAPCLSALAASVGGEIWRVEVREEGGALSVGLRRIHADGVAGVAAWAALPSDELKATVYGGVLAAVGPPDADGRLSVSTGDVIAEVTVGDRSLGRTPIRQVSVPAGAHRVAVESAGYEPWSTLAQIRPGRDTRLEARLVADLEAGVPLAALLPGEGDPEADGPAAEGDDAGPPSAARPPPPWLEPRPAPAPATWGALGGGLAAVSAGIVFGLRADAAAAEARAAQVQLDAAMHNDAAGRNALAANGLYAAGTVALGLGTYLLFRDLSGAAH